jgi:transposase
MRGDDIQQNELFSYGSLDERVPEKHPLRAIRTMVDEALREMSSRFDEIYPEDGRRSIPPERLLRALLLQMLYSVRIERMLMERLEYNLLFRWFVGLSASEPVWHPTVFTKDRDRLLEGAVADQFFSVIVSQARHKRLLSDEHFTVDGTLVEAWAGQKSFQRKNSGNDPLNSPPPDRGSNPTINWHKEKRSNETHESLTDPMARLYRKTRGAEAKLGYLGHILTENRNGLVVDVRLTQANGTAEREAEVSKRHAGRGSRIRYPILRCHDAGTQCHGARGAERFESAKCDRWAHDPAPRLRRQPAQTQTGGRSVRMDQDGGAAAENTVSRAGTSRLDVHAGGIGLQPGEDAKSSVRRRIGRSVSGCGGNAIPDTRHPS